MADHTDSFLQEVQEEMKREQMARLWDRYGVYAIVLAVLLLAGIGVYKFMEQRAISERNAAGVQFESATKLATDGKTEEALKAFESLAKSGPAGYAALARLRIAAADAAAKKTDQAVKTFEEVAKDTRVDQLLRDYAAYQAALLRVDSADWTEMQNRLNDLSNERNPWHAAARELLGMAALKAGKEDEARKYFEQLLGDRATPPAMVQRAQVLMTMLTEKALAKGATAPAATPAKAATKETPAAKGTETPAAPKGK